MFRKLAPHLPLLLGVIGMAFVVAAVWTIGRAELATTLGLTATGFALLVLEWRVTD